MVLMQRPRSVAGVARASDGYHAREMQPPLRLIAPHAVLLLVLGVVSAGCSRETDTAPVADAATDAPPKPKTGSIMLFQQPGPPPNSTFAVWFIDENLEHGCEIVAPTDSCLAALCKKNVYNDKPAVPPSAGTITASNASGGTLEATFDGAYYPTVSSGKFFDPGDTIQVSAAGGNVPTFAATLVVPQPLTLVAPACLTAGCPNLERGTDLSIAWTGGEGGIVMADLTTRDPVTGDGVEIACTAPGTSHQMTIPKSVLGLLQPGTGNGFGFLSVVPISRTRVVAGEWQVDVEVSPSGPSGTFATVK